MPSPLELVQGLAARRKRATPENFEQMFEEVNASSPERARLYKEMKQRMRRSGIPERIRTGNIGRPDISEMLGTDKPIFDYSNIGEYSHAYLEPRPMVVPKRGISPSFSSALSPGVLEDVVRDTREGLREGAQTWYDLSPGFDWQDRYAPKGDLGQLMRTGAGFSARTRVAPEVQQGIFFNYFLKQNGRPPTAQEMVDAGFGAGGSSPADKIGFARSALETGQTVPGELDHAVKIGAYGDVAAGNMFNSVVDTHNLLMYGLPETLGASPKGGVNMINQELARRMGLLAPQMQAAPWVPRARRALDPGVPEHVRRAYGLPKIGWLEKIVSDDAKLRGFDKFEHMKNVLEAEDYVRPTPYAQGGLALALGVGGQPEALMKYIRSRLPKKYGREELRHVQELRPDTGVVDPDAPSYGGSARDIYELGSNKLVKLAKRPRGLYEQTLEGDPRVPENLPKLHWRSPDDELTVVEKMRLTPEAAHQFFQPMGERVHELNRRSILPRHTWHRKDPRLMKMMEERGLEDFKPIDIHPGDFFFSPARHWAMRDLTGHGVNREGRLTLLDPGAMDYRITNPQFERQFGGQFRDVLDERLKSIMPERFYAKPEELIGRAISAGDLRPLRQLGIERGTEDFIGPGALWPSLPDSPQELEIARRLLPRERTHPPKLTGGMAHGGIAGRISRLRSQLNELRPWQGYDKGGVVRNWLRGVKGSEYEKALEALKERVSRMGAVDPDVDRMRDFREHERQLSGVHSKREALKKWIDTNLGNYLVKQHGLENDPLKAQDLLPHPAAVRKIPAAEVPRALTPGAVALTEEETNARVLGRLSTENPWLVKMFEQDRPRYLSQREYDKARKSVGHDTDSLLRDPQLDAMEQGVDPASTAYHRMVGERGGKLVGDMDLTPGSRDWQYMEKYQDEVKGNRAKLEEKYQRRHAPPIELHDLDKQTWEGYYEPEMRNVMDYLSHAMSPEAQAPFRLSDISRVGVPDAVRQSKAWHAAMAKKREEGDAAALAGLKVHKQYPTGERWVEMGGHGDQQILSGSPAYSDAQAAQQIGKSLGHCYQHPETCSSYLSGGKLFTLLDAKGKPRVTIEGQIGEHPRSQTGYNRLPDEVKSAYEAHFKGTGKHTMDFGRDLPEWMQKNYPDLVNNPQIHLGQILGPQDETIDKHAPDAIPFVQDFIRSGKWGNVENLQGTGLTKHKTRGGKQVYATPEEIAEFRRYKLFPSNIKLDTDQARSRAPSGEMVNHFTEGLSEDDAVRGIVEGRFKYPRSLRDQELRALSSIDPSAQEAQQRMVLDLLRGMDKEGFAGGPHWDIPDDWTPKGFADGGYVDELAGGGPPRNWLKGVKGSKYEKALARLRERSGDDLVRQVRSGEMQLTDLPEAARPGVQRNIAIQNWIDTNLGNYITRQHGTEGDPLREVLPEIMRHPAYESAVKKIPAAEVPDIFWDGTPPKPSKRRPGQLYEGLDLPEWLKQQVDKDWPRHWSKQQYNAMVNDAGGVMNPAKNLSKLSPEELETVKKAQKEHGQRYQRRYEPPIELYDINDDVWRSHYEPEFTNVLDYLRHATGPEAQAPFRLSDVSRVSVPDAVRQSKAWHEALAKKAEEAKAGLMSGPFLKEHKGYPTGFRWVEYNPPGSDPAISGIKDHAARKAAADERIKGLKAALSAEGESMGHCVGDYCDDVLSGNTRILSLRDPKGRPHVTVEVMAGADDEVLRNLRDAKIIQGQLPSIVQIKGKANRRPNDEYLPYVQDFVRSGKWGEVGDLKNTGLEPIVSQSGRTYHMTPEEAAPFASEWPHTPRDAAGNPLSKAVKKGRYVKGDRYLDYNIPDDYAYPPTKFAAGGDVRPPDFPREGLDERLMRAELSLQILLEEASQPGYTPEQVASLQREISRMTALVARLKAAGAKGETRVKEDPASKVTAAPAAPPVLSGSGAPAGVGGEDDESYEQALEMLGRFVTGDSSSEGFLKDLLA